MGTARGASFLKICILGIFGDISSRLPEGPGGRVNVGHRGDSFLKIYILGIFGDVSSKIILDRCRKSPKKYFDSQGDQGGE